MSDTKPEYIALVLLGAGGAFGRSTDPVEAINIARREAGQFARPFGGFKMGTALKMNIFDVTGMGDLSIGHDGVFEDGSNRSAPHLRVVEVPHAKPFTEAQYKAGVN